MKLRELLYGLGLRPRVREYGYQIESCELGGATLRYARWLHPKAEPRLPDDRDLALARSLLGVGDTAIDIGAHAGDTTIPMAVAVGATGTVFAFEPNPYVFKVLAVNAQLNHGRLRVVAYPFAAMERDGEAEFAYGDPGFCNGGFEGGRRPWQMRAFFRVKVQGRDIAALLRREHPQALARLRHVKIDTEGHDFAVFRSIRGLLAPTRPSLRTEINRFMPAQERIAYVRALRDAGYTPYRLDPGASEPGPPVDERSAVEWRHFDILALAGRA